MRGLGSQQPPAQEQGTTQSASAMLGDMDESALEQATPEEQAQYEAFVESAQNVIYPADKPGEVNPSVLNNLQGQFDPSALQLFEQAEPALTDSPQDSAAATTVLLTIMTERGQQFSDEVVFHGGAAIAEDLIEVAEAAKIHDFSDQDIETVTYRAMDLYRIASPRADPAALSEQFKQLMAANEQGNLGAVLPGLPGGAAMNQQEG